LPGVPPFPLPLSDLAELALEGVFLPWLSVLGLEVVVAAPPLLPSVEGAFAFLDGAAAGAPLCCALVGEAGTGEPDVTAFALAVSEFEPEFPVLLVFDVLLVLDVLLVFDGLPVFDGPDDFDLEAFAALAARACATSLRIAETMAPNSPPP
jgi:hypothetical protein